MKSLAIIKKFMVFFVLLHLSSLTAIAQTNNVSIDRLRFTYGHRELPTHPLNPIRFDYGVRVIATPAVRNNVSIEDIADAVTIRGQVRADNPADASVVVELTLGNIVIASSNVRERREEVRDRSGNVTGTNHFFWVEVVYTFESSYRVMQGGNQVRRAVEIYNRAASSNQRFNTESFRSRREASDFWNNNRENLIAEFYQSLATNSANTVSNALSRAYGFSGRTNVRGELRIMNENRHNENATFREKTTTLRDELQSLTPNTPLDRERIAEIIEYFKSLPERYADTRSRADQRIRYAAWYNLCQIYFFLGEPENVAQYADLIIANRHNQRDGTRLKNRAAELTAAFDRTGIRTRHFSPDVLFGDGVFDPNESFDSDESSDDDDDDGDE